MLRRIWILSVFLLGLAGNAYADVVVFSDGTRLSVRSYARKGNLVVFTTLDGKMQSVASRYVDLETTEHLNQPNPRATQSTTPAEDRAQAQRSEVAGVTGDEPRLASLQPVPIASPAAPAPEPAASFALQAPGPTQATPTAVSRAAPSSLPSFSPPAPIAPEVIAYDTQGRITVRATRLAEPLVIDGKVDDPAYSRVQSVTGFIQQDPNEGEPASEDTEAWIFFDDRNFYVGVRCWDKDPERIIANEMRRDNNGITRNDNMTLTIDTLYDRRNGFYFTVNAISALRDMSVGDEGQNNNVDWNTVWNAKASIDDQGWSVEMAIPFKSLRFKQTGPQVWSLNLRRTIGRKNERSFLAPIPNSYGGQGPFQFSLAATLVGVEVPGSNRVLELEPFALSAVTTDQKADDPFSNQADADFGLDLKYGLTSSLIADFTYNTDFAQVEEDTQQINLTRFNLLFPEKRDFFLEGQSIFAFGGGQAGGRGRNGLTPIMFFSRRIGLTEEGVDPIRAGGRVTGRAGKYRIGALNIQTRGDVDNPLLPPTNFSVLRTRRDVFSRSDIGVIATYRNSSLTEGAASNGVFGFDGNFLFLQNLQLNAYYALSRTTFSPEGRESVERSGNDRSSYTGKLDYGGDRYGLILEHLYVGRDFLPELGFLRREAFKRNFVQGRFSPRPASIDAIRRFVWQADFDYITNPSGSLLETKNIGGVFRIEFETGDQARVIYNNSYEFLPEPFEISDGVILPVGGYNFQNVRFGYTLGPQRRVPSSINFETGGFYDGTRNALDFNARFEVSPKFSIEPRGSLDWVKLPEGNFNARVGGVRVTYTFNPRMYVGSFIQMNTSSDTLNVSARFRWEYEPGSDIFVVYTEGRDDLSLSPFLANRTFAVKFTKLFRF